MREHRTENTKQEISSQFCVFCSVFCDFRLGLCLTDHLLPVWANIYYYILSITNEDAPPPPLQMPVTPILALFFPRTLIKVATILAPEQPIGCPNETAPPQTFTFLGSRFSF